MNLVKKFFKFTIPSIVSMWIFSLYSMVDGIFVSWGVGEHALTAVNLSLPFVSLIFTLGILLATGTSTILSIALGQGDVEKARNYFNQNLFVVIVTTVILSVIVLLNLDWVAHFLGSAPENHHLVKEYVGVIAAFSVFFTVSYNLEVQVKADGAPHVSIIGVTSCGLMNVLLDYIFVMHFHWGVWGAALATGIAPVVGLCVSSLHILTRRSHFRLRPFRPALRPLADLAGLGSAAFLNECSSGLVLVVFNLLTLRLAGTLGVAAYGIVANLALMALALFTGVNQGVQPLVSLAHGRGDAAGVRTLCRMALGLALCAGMCMAALAFFAAGPLVSLFNRDGDPALQQMAEQGLRLYFLGFPFAGLNLVTASFLGAAEHPSRSLRLSLLRGFVAIVAAALLLAALLGLTGVWLAFPAAEGAVLLVSLRFSRSLRRARPEPAPQAITTALR